MITLDKLPYKERLISLNLHAQFQKTFFSWHVLWISGIVYLIG